MSQIGSRPIRPLQPLGLWPTKCKHDANSTQLCGAYLHVAAVQATLLQPRVPLCRFPQ